MRTPQGGVVSDARHLHEAHAGIVVNGHVSQLVARSTAAPLAHTTWRLGQWKRPAFWCPEQQLARGLVLKRIAGAAGGSSALRWESPKRASKRLTVATETPTRAAIERMSIRAGAVVQCAAPKQHRLGSGYAAGGKCGQPASMRLMSN